MWKGAAATLNAKPVNTSSEPTSSSGLCSSGVSARNAPMRARFVVPVAP